MASTPKKDGTPEGDPRGGDAILKRMLQTKPKTHDELVAERHKPHKTAPKTGRGKEGK